MPNDRNRPRRTVSIDPVTDAFLGKPEVNAGRLIDSLVESNVSKSQLKRIAREKQITVEETGFAGIGIDPEEIDR